MFDPDELPELKEQIRESTERDRHLLNQLCKDIGQIKNHVRSIRPRSATAVSLVASDGGNNKLTFDPFLLQIVRVVDSYGKRLCFDVVSPTTDPDDLSKRQFDDGGAPRTALGRLMLDLGVKTLNGLSPAIPKGEVVRRDPDAVKPGWVLTYRDVCEWATLYERICYKSFPTDTLLVRDGLLRGKMFAGDLFIKMALQMQAKIEEIRRTERRQVFLVGMAKHSQVLDRYRLAMALEELFSTGEPKYVRIPREVEGKVYKWEEYARGMEAIGREGEEPKFVAGTMHFVRFGTKGGDPVWPVDLFDPQVDRAAEVFGYLLNDAISGFPVPLYPRCLQKAHEWAEVADFDAVIMQDEILNAVRNLLPGDKREVLDAESLRDKDVAGRRYA
jgi:hypothetical protein